MNQIEKKSCPKVSLVLTSYNCKDNIRRTLDSIERQSYQNIEILIADGGSSDGTVDIIKEYEECTSRNMKWISEPDNGIYDAMNKGYRMSTGDIIAFFNEEFVNKDAVKLMVEAIEDNDCVGAHADFVYATDTEVKRLWRMEEGKITQGWMPGHPTLYLKREIYEKYGLYKDNYKYSADYELMVRVLHCGKEKIAYVPTIIARMYYGGTSTNSVKAYYVTWLEAHNALRKNNVRGAFLIDVKRTLRLFGQFKEARGMTLESIRV